MKKVNFSNIFHPKRRNVFAVRLAQTLKVKQQLLSDKYINIYKINSINL